MRRRQALVVKTAVAASISGGRVRPWSREVDRRDTVF